MRFINDKLKSPLKTKCAPSLSLHYIRKVYGKKVFVIEATERRDGGCHYDRPTCYSRVLGARIDITFLRVLKYSVCVYYSRANKSTRVRCSR